ncbi:MAG TPA: CHAT domain-containing tetratricopeptide repeat protein [Thermoanaerobaculia bacterium]|nr:CHAT domain-containing tetratricopeptide repeat protein [Thermoanaerobaculia bacterium]
MRLWFGLGLLSIGALLLVAVPPSISPVAVLAGSSHSGAEHLDLLQQSIGRADEENQQAERLIARGMEEDRQGHPAAALDLFQEALRLARQTHSSLSEAHALAASGTAASELGELADASDYYEQTLEKWKHVGSPADRLKTLQDLAQLHLQVGEPGLALDLLRQARDIDPSPALTTRLVGMSLFIGRRDGIALQILRRALDQARVEEDAELQATVLGDIGSVALRLGDVEQAAAAFEECLRIAMEAKYLPGEAYARAGRGRVLGARGRYGEAMIELERAATMFRSQEDPESLALVLAGEAMLEQERGNLQRALDLSSESMSLIEAQRKEIESPRARAALLGVSSDPYEIQIDVLQRLAEGEPGGRFEAQAFEVSEKIRARTLYEALAAGGTSRRPGTADLQRQRREVTFKLRALERERLSLSEPSGEEDRSRLEAIDAEIRTLVARESELWEKLRRSDPRSALAGLQPLSLPQVQSLLDADTALLVYTLGKDRSFVWWIERDSFSMLTLPARSQIEELARRVQSLLAEPGSKHELQLNESLAQLSETVLGPVADKLPRVRRLAVVPDGALQTLPFAAIPQPRMAGPLAGEPLVASHVTVVLPSPSTLAALRRRERDRATTPDKLIAVITDPVFEETDPRIARLPSSEPALSPLGLTRLKQTKKEAGAILGLVPKGMGREISGFEAVPEIVTDPDLRHYRYLHFGTHGIVNEKQPELSGIVLSQFNPDGSHRDDGLLRFYDVYDLDLPVELVSLSTCRSANGPQIRREGPITMTRSFFYAGASRVLGTLWDVSDKPAAALTTAFYEGILRGGKRPSEALRDAQDAMRRQGWPRHDWAAFVLQGDWR